MISISLGSDLRRHRLNHDEPSQLFANGQSRIADLTNQIGVAGEQPDDSILAKADFAEAILHFGPGAQLANAHLDASFDEAQRTDFATRFVAAYNIGGQLRFHLTGISVAPMGDRHYTEIVIPTPFIAQGGGSTHPLETALFLLSNRVEDQDIQGASVRAAGDQVFLLHEYPRLQSDKTVFGKDHLSVT